MAYDYGPGKKENQCRLDQSAGASLFGAEGDGMPVEKEPATNSNEPFMQPTFDPKVTKND